MNPAARAAFAPRLEDFSASLPASLIRRFAQFAERKEGGFAKIKIPGAPGLSCSIDLLKLADGQDGLIVAEVANEEGRRAAFAPTHFRTPKSQPKKTAKKAAASPQKPGRKTPQTPPALTAEEMLAFKAVGRKVLRLCAEKACLKEPPAAVSPLPAPAPAPNLSRSPDRPPQGLTDLLPAFDLVLFLNESLDIVGVQGRPTWLGWRKAKLARKTAGDLLAPYDRALLRRMLKKLRRQTVFGSRDALLVSSEDGNTLRCRAVVGRWEDGDAAFFLGLLLLEVPVRPKRRQRQDIAAPGRLAA
jgi:hypothetical protein